MEGKLSPQTFEALKNAHAAAKKEAEAMIGKTLQWALNPSSAHGRAKYPFKGRKCVVVGAIYDKFDGDIEILVKTYKASGEGFMDSNDSVHRVYRGLQCFEEVSGEAPNNVDSN